MASRKIVINLPEDKMRDSVLKGLNKRLSMLEDMITAGKKKKTLDESATLKNEIRHLRDMKASLNSRESREIKESVKSIAEALSSLGKIRIPSPS